MLRYWREKGKARRRKARSAGVCNRCFQHPPSPGYVRCELCREADRKRYTKSRA
jgi:hypothetical protein